MIFSKEHEDFIKNTLNNLPLDYLKISESIQNISSNEKVIWHLTCQWMKSLHGTNEDRRTAHLQQLQYVMVCMGRMINILTDEEWDQVGDSWNIHLSHLRTFNGSFLGRHYQNYQIGSRTADFYNIYAWIISLHQWFARDINEIIEKRSEKISDNDLRVIDQSLQQLMLSILVFQSTHKVTNEITKFVTDGLNLSCGINSGSWESYFSKIENKPTPPSFTID